MKNTADKSCMATRNTHFILKKFPPSENRAVYDMWTDTVEPDRPRMKMWHMRIASWITKAKNAYTQVG
jgi:hypothetical protein